MEDRRCSKCHEIKPLTDFYGENRYCKQCRSLLGKTHTLAHPGESATYQRQWRLANPDKGDGYRKRYVSTHRQKVRVCQREYYLAHADELCIKAQERRRMYPEEETARNREYQRTHPEECNARTASYRARKRRLPGWDYTTVEMIRARWEIFGRRCWICGEPGEATDHVKPVAKGGAYFPCNLRPICKSCNSKKSDKWPYPPQIKKAMRGITNGL